MPPSRLLYAHGFASGPQSSKGKALNRHLAGRGRALELLDLRVPDPNHLRLSAMIDVVRSAIPEGETAIAMGSSLGGLTVARAAEREPRIRGVLLIAPAFRLVPRWRQRMTKDEWETWQRTGSKKFPDYSYGTSMELDVDFGFVDDAASIDVDGPDDAPGAWPEVHVPTIVIQGQNDDVVDPELARAFARRSNLVELVEVVDDHQMLGSIEVIQAQADALIERLGA
jgi:pimeloyl-ACP methyl ester carboxylesterase